jgi:hypothetical protein
MKYEPKIISSVKLVKNSDNKTVPKLIFTDNSFMLLTNDIYTSPVLIEDGHDFRAGDTVIVVTFMD